MSTLDDLLGMVLHVRHTKSFTGCHAKHIYGVSPVVHTSHGAQREFYGVLGITSHLHASCLPATHAHYLIIHAVQGEIAAYRISLCAQLWEEELHHTRTDDAHLTLLLVIHIIDGTSVTYLGVIHLMIILPVSQDMNIAIVMVT